jgi:hypothetical protein
VIITALRDRSGTLVGFGKVTRDFTERMETKAALEKSERSLRELSLHPLSTQDLLVPRISTSSTTIDRDGNGNSRGFSDGLYIQNGSL